MTQQITFPYTPRDWAISVHEKLSGTSTRCYVTINHRRCGKSWAGAAFIVMSALTRAGRHMIIGPQIKTMTAIFWPILQHFLRDIPGVEWKKGEAAVYIPCSNGGTSIISIHSAGDQEKGSNIRGLQAISMLVDEADSVGVESFWGEVWPVQANVEHPQAWISGTPRGDQLLADLLRQAETTDGWHGVQLGVYDTQVLSDDEIAATKDQMPPDQFKREMLARTDVGTEDQLIKIENVLACMNNDITERERRSIVSEHAMVLGVDVGRLRDQTVIARRQGPVVHQLIRMEGATTQEIALRVLNEAKQHQADGVFVDAGSMGVSVIDVMIQLGLNPIPINFGGTATDPELYTNRRAEMFDRVRAWTEKANSCLPNEGSTKLQKELTAPLFKLNATNKLQIEAKADIKKRLGHSTDALDAIALTFAAHVPSARITGLDDLVRPSGYRVERAADGSRYYSHDGAAAAIRRRERHMGDPDELREERDLDSYHAHLDGDGDGPSYHGAGPRNTNW